MFRQLLAAIATVFRRPMPRLKAPPMFELPEQLLRGWRRSTKVPQSVSQYRRRRKVRMQMQRESRRQNRAA